MSEKHYYETLAEKAKVAAGREGGLVQIFPIVVGLSPSDIIVHLHRIFLFFCELGQDKKAAEVLTWLEVAVREELVWPHTDDDGHGRRLYADSFDNEGSVIIAKQTAVKMSALAVDLWLKASEAVLLNRNLSESLCRHALPESRRLLARQIVIGWREAASEEQAKICLSQLAMICLKEVVGLKSEVVTSAIREEVSTLSRQRFFDFFFSWKGFFKEVWRASNLVHEVWHTIAKSSAVSLGSEQIPRIAEILRPFGEADMSEAALTFLCRQSELAAAADRAVADLEKKYGLRDVAVDLLGPRHLKLKGEFKHDNGFNTPDPSRYPAVFEADRSKIRLWLAENPNWEIQYEMVVSKRYGKGILFQREETLTS